jgi:uncharacterized membrane protein
VVPRRGVALAVLAEGAEASAAAAQAEAGKTMRTKDFLSRLDHDRIVAAIREAEGKSSGEIRVFVQRGELEGDPLVAAQKKFHQLRMDATKERNGVLIFVLPRARKFAVIGDEGIHRKCGPQFWQELVEKMRTHFQHENFTDALVEAIETAGQLLAQHFPRQGGDRNELSDKVLEG